MQIENRLPSAIYRSLIAILAGLSLKLEYSQFGEDTFRLFSAWFLLATTTYYIISTLWTIFRRKRSAGQVVCPMFQGLLISAGMILLTSNTVFLALDFPRPELDGTETILICYVLPFFVLLDWLLFSKKGHWRTIEPLYWLSLPISFVCFILITAMTMSETATLRYPYEFLNWPKFGIDTMFWELGVIAVLTLAFSYLCWLIDFTMSGKLAKTIVLPKIKTIVIEDEPEMEEEPPASTDEKIEVIEPKIKINISNPKKPKSDAKASASVTEDLPAKDTKKASPAKSAPKIKIDIKLDEPKVEKAEESKSEKSLDKNKPNKPNELNESNKSNKSNKSSEKTHKSKNQSKKQSQNKDKAKKSEEVKKSNTDGSPKVRIIEKIDPEK